MESVLSFLQANRLTIRGMMVGFIILVLMIPMAQISELVRERQDRQRQVSAEVSNRWASNQTINGPILIIPYLELSPDQKNMFKKLAYFLPAELDFDVKVTPQIRHRSIYKIIVYQSEVMIKGRFDSLNLDRLNLAESSILWNEASLCLGLSDFRGIEEQVQLKWDGQTHSFESGAATNDIVENGLKINLPYRELKSKPHTFSIQMHIKGSQNLSFVPSGKTTQVHMQSTWPDPSFTGSFLPGDQAKITAAGFEANWKVLDLNRNFPQQFKDTKYDVLSSSFGVDFLQGSDHYSKTTRSVKYALLFIGLTLALYYFIEIFQKKRVHAFQYVLVGLSLCIFYTLLLSVSEYIPFDGSYLIVSMAIIIMVYLYTGSVFGSRRIAGIFSGILALLYGFIYVLIQLQDWALLLGSIGLFVILALVMYYSRKLDLS